MLSTNTASLPVSIPLNTNGGGFGGGNGFSDIIALAIIAMIFGWNGNGGGIFGGGRGQSTSVYEGYVLNNDFSQLSKQISDTYNMTDRKFEGIANGICSLGYDQLAQMNGINTNIMTQGNAIQSQLADCCCKTQQAIGDVKYAIGSTGADINYNLATQANMLDRTVSDKFCQTNFNNATNTRDIIDAINMGNRGIYDKLCQMESNAKDDKIAELQAKNFDLRLAASQEAQNNYLVDKLGYHMPVAAFQVPNPFTTCTCNNGCGCA